MSLYSYKARTAPSFDSGIGWLANQYISYVPAHGWERMGPFGTMYCMMNLPTTVVLTTCPWPRVPTLPSLDRLGVRIAS